MIVATKCLHVKREKHPAPLYARGGIIRTYILLEKEFLKMRKIISLLLMTILAVTLLSACSKSSSDPEVGDVVSMGSYKGEDIEWEILDINDEGQMLIVSTRAIDIMRYNESQTTLSWEECTLRGWLNGSFIEEAFDGEQQEHILTTTVINNDNEFYNIEGGNDTQDKVFLLSLDEVRNYYDEDEDRICLLADNVDNSNEEIADLDSRQCNWWLRSPGSYRMNAAYVEIPGSINEHGIWVDWQRGVRPAMWVDEIV